jgi:hypothetical protein
MNTDRKRCGLTQPVRLPDPAGGAAGLAQELPGIAAPLDRRREKGERRKEKG